VVVFHEQVIEMIAAFAGVSNAEADEVRRALGDVEGMAESKLWFFPRALGRGYPLELVEKVWAVLEAFASFGFCKAHAAAFALPTYQSAWLKAHWPAHFLAGVLTHDPGMYPKRLILDDARQFGITVLGLDVNHSDKTYAVERVGEGYGIRLALAEVKGISDAEVGRVVAARPFHSLTDLWHRARVSRPVLERLVLAGGFDSVYGIGSQQGVRRRGKVTRRDLLLQVAELDRHTRAVERAARGRGFGRGPRVRSAATVRAVEAGERNSSDPRAREGAPTLERHPLAGAGVWAKAAAQSQASRVPPPVSSVQLTLDLGDEPAEGEVSGLPEMDDEERMKAELEILGLDVTRHVVDTYAPFLDELGITRSRELLARRSKAELLVAGVKVATQTPPIRSGRRVIFLTLDDATGPVDATFFEDVQGPYAATVFHSWLLVVRGELRRTGRRGVSLRATGAWALPELFALWQAHGIDAVREAMAVVPEGFAGVGAGDRRRVLVHSSGFQMSPYSDIRPAGEETRGVARKLWHRSPGSAG
jgi:error-prone DNA polymerase